MMGNFLFKKNLKFQVLIFSFFLELIFIPNIVSGQTTQQQLENVKLQKEIELLNVQIKNSSHDNLNMFNTLYTQTIPIIVTIVGAGATAFFGWQRERKVPPTAEQERILQDMIKEWYSRNFLNAYHHIWSKIEKSNNDESLIDEIWQKLSSKEFPKEYKSNNEEEDLFRQIEYFRKKLKLDRKGSYIRKFKLDKIEYFRKRLDENDDELKKRIEAIRNSADVEYYAGVRRVLPTIADIAVMATIRPIMTTIHSKDKSDLMYVLDNNYESLVASSLENLKKLMIFYRLRENQQVCEILIKAKLNEIILNPSSTSTDASASNKEV